MTSIEIHDALDHAFLVFCISWVIWGVSTHFLLYRNRPVAFRRTWHRRVALMSAAFFFAFLLFIVSIGFPSRVVLFFAPVLAVVTFVNIRNTRFCDACGRQSFKFSARTPSGACRHCKTPFDQRRHAR